MLQPTARNTCTISQWQQIAGFINNRQHQLLTQQAGLYPNPVITHQE